MGWPRSRLLCCISNYTPFLVAWFFLDFFAFLIFSLSALLLSKYSSKLLLYYSSQDDGNAVAIALSPPWLPPLTVKLSCTIIRSVKRKKETIINYHVEFEHVQTT